MALTLLCQRHCAAFLRSSAIKQTYFTQLAAPKLFSTYGIPKARKKISISKSFSKVCNSTTSVYFLKSNRCNFPMLTIIRTISRTHVRFSPNRNSGRLQDSNKTGLIYIVAVFIFMLGGAYAGVPLYKVFCQVSN